MQDRTGTDSNSRPIPVSPNNPCPFLRATVSEGHLDGRTVPLRTLAQTVQAASGKTGFEKTKVGIETRLVALVANGLNPFRLLRSWWSGATLDELRNGRSTSTASARASWMRQPMSMKARSSVWLLSARTGSTRWAAAWSAG
jgi:hypothetical protein